MHIKTKKRLFYALTFFVLVASGIGIILYNLSSNIAFFVTPTQLLEKPITSEVKLGGYVKAGSIVKIDIDEIEFEVTDKVNHIKVKYKGPIPTIFRENQGVVVTGVYNPGGAFIAYQLLAKHDEKYMPKSFSKTKNKS